MSEAETPARGGEAETREELVARAVEQGLLTEAQVDECKDIIERLVEMGLRRRSLEEILEEKGYLGANVMRRLECELSKERGEIIPGYKLIKRLGRGSSGVVYTPLTSGAWIGKSRSRCCSRS